MESGNDKREYEKHAWKTSATRKPSSPTHADRWAGYNTEQMVQEVANIMLEGLTVEELYERARVALATGVGT
eukprot:4000284-Prorocentrum_lima.AAC.1